MAHGSEQWAAWFGSRSNWLQFVSRCGDVCVAKSPRPMSTSTGVCLTAVVEVDVCVASEPHGLDERGSNESATVMVCTVVGPVAVGCSWARFPAILWSRKILSLFRLLSGAATCTSATHVSMIQGACVGVSGPFDHPINGIMRGGDGQCGRHHGARPRKIPLCSFVL